MATLQLLRGELVLGAQRALAEARAELAQREALLHEASKVRVRCEEELQGERAQFGGARSVLALRRGEERMRGLTVELRAAEARLAAARKACSDAQARVDVALHQLVEAEAGRRGVAHVVEERRVAAARGRERLEEEEAEELHRARQHDG